MTKYDPQATRIVSDHELTDCIDIEFPIESQTSRSDKLVLLKLRAILQDLPSYSYVEIGSFLGGSLTPFLKDSNCARVLSIDDRGRHQPDERGITFDYTSITHQTMLDNLSKYSFPIQKIETFDGSVSNYRNFGALYDMMFIDGEHTDWACFRDFIHGRKILKDTAIIAFHDSDLIHRSLRIIQEYLASTDSNFKFFKVKDSAMSVILLNDFCSLQIEDIFSIEADLERYYCRCDQSLLIINARNRMSSREIFIALLKRLFGTLRKFLKQSIRKAYCLFRPASTPD